MEQKNSYDLYLEQEALYYRRKVKPEAEAIQLLLETMKEELLIDGCSLLLNVAYYTCKWYCRDSRLTTYQLTPRNYSMKELNRKWCISVFDAWCLIHFLEEDMSDELDKKELDVCAGGFYQYCFPRNWDSREFYRSMMHIDNTIVGLRREMYKKAADYNRAMSEKAAAACQPPLTDASPAVREAYSSEPQEPELSHEERMRASEEAYKREQEAMDQRLMQVREALMRSNEAVRQMEDLVCEGMTRKVAYNLLELYNLIADTRDNVAQGRQITELETAVCNMEVFLEMIEEYMTAFGVSVIKSAPGEPFTGKLHTAGIVPATVDLRHATIGRSRRSGFRWDQVVLQKEMVELEEHAKEGN